MTWFAMWHSVYLGVYLRDDSLDSIIHIVYDFVRDIHGGDILIDTKKFIILLLLHAAKF